MEYVIDGNRVVATVPDGQADRFAQDGQVIAIGDRAADWPEDYRLARIELSDAAGYIRDSAALQDLPSASEAEQVMRQLLTEIDKRLAK